MTLTNEISAEPAPVGIYTSVFAIQLTVLHVRSDVSFHGRKVAATVGDTGDMWDY